MIAKPATRDMARTNAILAAENAHFAAEEQETGPEHATSWANVSQAWSAIAQTFPYDEDPYYMDLTDTERETIVRIREGSLTTVHPDYIVEHMALVRNQFNVEPGYVGMAVTPEEQRAVMAMRSGARPEDTTQTLPVIHPGHGGVRVSNDLYSILMAITVEACTQAIGDGGGVVLIHPEDIEATYTKNVLMERIDNGPNSAWKVWLTESGS